MTYPSKPQKPAERESLIPQVVAIAEEAGLLLLDRDGETHAVTDKGGDSGPPNNFTTEGDLAAESLILRRLRAVRPHDVFIAEESAQPLATTDAGVPELTWHIDPLDGTTNFSRGLGGYSVSIAAVDTTGRTVLGVVHSPTAKTTYVANETMSELRIGEDARPLKATVYATSHILGTGFAYEAGERQRLMRVLDELMPFYGDLRVPGSFALDLCQVGVGGVDAYIQLSVRSWDFMAARLIAENAGVQVLVLPNPRTGNWAVAAAKTNADFSQISNALRRALSESP